MARRLSLAAGLGFDVAISNRHLDAECPRSGLIAPGSRAGPVTRWKRNADELSHQFAGAPLGLLHYQLDKLEGTGKVSGVCRLPDRDRRIRPGVPRALDER